MSDSLPAIAAVAVGPAGGAKRAPLPGERARAQEAPSAPETRAAARRELETQGRYQVRIHAETMRVITEIVDMVTGDTLMYLPPGYRPDTAPTVAKRSGA
jgi:hypothetical protein